MRSNLVYPELYDQILRESRYKFIKEKFEVDAFVTELTSCLSHTLYPFLTANLATKDSKSLREWSKDLDKVFIAAIRLRQAVLLSDAEMSFVWPRANECSNYMTMKSDDELHVQPDRKVHLGLFPALMSAWETGVTLSRPKERTVFPAVVILQR